MRSNSIWLRQITTEASISNYNFVEAWSTVPYIAHCSVETFKTPYVHLVAPSAFHPRLWPSLGSLPIRSMRASNDRERSILCTIYWWAAWIREESYKRGIVAWRRIASITRIVTIPLLNTLSSLFVVRYSENAALRIFHVSHIRDKDYRVLRFNDFYTQVTSPEIIS